MATSFLKVGPGTRLSLSGRSGGYCGQHSKSEYQNAHAATRVKLRQNRESGSSLDV